MSTRSLDPVFDALGYRFRKPDLLTEALTHPSHEGQGSYERLEFLGDRVLGLIVAERLYEMFPDAEEGRMAPLLNLLVRRETLAKVAKTIGLPEFLILAPGEASTGDEPSRRFWRIPARRSWRRSISMAGWRRRRPS